MTRLTELDYSVRWVMAKASTMRDAGYGLLAARLDELREELEVERAEADAGRIHGDTGAGHETVD